MKKAIVTGGSGFIGTHLVNRLEELGWEVDVYDIKNGDNILDKEKLLERFKGKEICFHLAGMLGTHELVDCAQQAVAINVIGTLNVLDACRDNGVKLIEISKPNCWVNTYTITKIAAESFTEMYRKEFGLKAITVKWFNVYGGGQPLMEEAGYKKLIPTAIVKALNNEPIEIYGNGEQTMDLIHTDDAVGAVMYLVNNWERYNGGTYEVGSGEEITVNDAVKKIIELTNSKSEIVHIPMRKGEWDNTHIKAKINFDWIPTVSIIDGLIETIEWYAKKGD